MRNSQTDYERELRVATELAREAGALLLGYYKTGLKVEQKNDDGHSEPVTAADRAANELIVTRLRQEFPGDGVLAEESLDSEHRLQREFVWLIDPMDGTTSFIDGKDDFAVQIGLADRGVAVVGAVYLPVAGKLYWAARGRGAWLEEKVGAPRQLRVSQKKDFHQMVVASSRSHRSPRMEQVVQAFGFKHEVQRGSVGIKVGLIAERLADLYIHLSPRTKQWDTCGPEVILTEAGGRVTDLFGKPLRYNSVQVQNLNGIVATNGAAHETVIGNLTSLLANFGRRPA